ncbi:TOMM precursor leader peptide-binding protein [Ruegeria sp. SCP11]|uniref:TOMM precursor leader peptide-binding protein n=1 Tax=Ruegeria sp. SCP11 TaxID=3141378 RepID=UPI00333A3C3E
MTDRVLILTAGRFGVSVAKEIADHLQDTTVRPLAKEDGGAPKRYSEYTFVVLATWRRYFAVSDALDEALWEVSVPWCDVTLEGSVVRVGPHIRPGLSACYACYRTRFLSNSAIADRELALDACFDRGPEIGIAGFTPAQVRIGSALVRAQIQGGSQAAGRLQLLDPASGALRSETVTRVHGCARCGVQSEPGTRYWRALRGALGPVSKGQSP